MRPKRHRDCAIDTPDTARNQRRHQEIAAAATIGFGNSNARVPLRGQPLPEPAWEIISAFNLCIMGTNFSVSKRERTFVCQLMLFREFKIHRASVLSDQKPLTSFDSAAQKSTVQFFLVVSVRRSLQS